MEILFIWLICGVACAAIAEKKNRSKLAWFVLGCTFGVFTLAAAFIAPKLEEGRK